MDSDTKITRQNIDSLASRSGFAKSTIIEFNKELEKNEYISIFKLPYYIREKGYKVFKNSYIFKNAGQTAWVTRYFLDNGNTTLPEKNLILLLLPYKDKNNLVKMSNPKIATAIGLAIRTVNPLIASLAKKGYAKKIDRVTLFLDMDKIMDKKKDIDSKESKIKQSETKPKEDLPLAEANVEPEAISVGQDLQEIEWFDVATSVLHDSISSNDAIESTPEDTSQDSVTNISEKEEDVADSSEIDIIDYLFGGGTGLKSLVAQAISFKSKYKYEELTATQKEEVRLLNKKIFNKPNLKLDHSERMFVHESYEKECKIRSDNEKIKSIWGT